MFKIKNNSGSMLMSVIISLAILATLITLAIPNLRQYKPNLILSGFSQDLTSDLRYAQQLTVTEQIQHLVFFDSINNNYQILKFNGATSTLKTVSLPTELNYQSITGFTYNLVKFNSYGGVSENGSIILINDNSNTRPTNHKKNYASRMP